jgi:hypothetical protein
VIAVGGRDDVLDAGGFARVGDFVGAPFEGFG